MKSLREAASRRKRFLVALFVAALGGCAHSNAPVATEADATRAQARFPGITLAELNQGRKAYVGHCGGCHLPPSPTAHPVDSWPAHVHEMSERAGLERDEASIVIRYLQTMAAKSE